jgi:hypothetical protein
MISRVLCPSRVPLNSINRSVNTELDTRFGFILFLSILFYEYV